MSIDTDAGLAALRALPLSTFAPLILIPAFVVGLFVIFLFVCATRGMPRTPRMEKLAKSKLVPRLILEFGYWMLQLPVRALVLLGISANMLTMISLGFAVLSAFYIGDGRFAVGGWVLYVSFIFDAFDGMVARARGTSSDRGEYFDAFVDRYADFACFLGYMWYYRTDALPLALAAAGLAGSSVMGYARAKGEAVGIDPNVGWMARHERAVALGSFTVLAPLLSAFVEPGAAHPRYPLAIVALGLVALLSNVAAVQRAYFVMSRMPKPAAPAPEPEPSREALVDEEQIA